MYKDFIKVAKNLESSKTASYFKLPIINLN